MGAIKNVLWYRMVWYDIVFPRNDISHDNQALTVL